MLSKRSLGINGPHVGAIGYGAMVLEGYYGNADEHEGLRTVQHALDNGNGHNETLVAEAVRNRRDDAVVATKCGIVFEADQQRTEVPTGWGFSPRINGTPKCVRHALDESLRRLQIETIDLWYLHFPDPAIAISETIGAMAEEPGRPQVSRKDGERRFPMEPRLPPHLRVSCRPSIPKNSSTYSYWG